MTRGEALPRRSPIDTEGPGRTVRQSRARRQGVERRTRLRRRSMQPARPGVHAGRASTSTQVFINRAGPAAQSPRASRSHPTGSSSSSTSPTTATRTSSCSIARRCRCSISSAAQREARRLPGPASHRDRFEGQPLHRRGRAGQSRPEVRLQGNVAHAAAQRRSGRGASAERRRARFRHRVRRRTRRLSALDQRDDQPVSRDPGLAAPRHIKPGAAIGIIPDGKGGTWLHHRSEPPILHIDQPATSISGSATACSCRRTDSVRTATATSGGRQRSVR